MKLEFKPTLEMRASAKHAEAALSLANDIVDRVLHEDWHDNPQMVVGVMMAMAETYTALTIREGFEELVEALGKRDPALILPLRSDL